MKAKYTMVLLTASGLVSGMAQAAYVNIGDGGALGSALAGGANAADSTGYGSVGYNFSISDREVSIAEIQASGAGNGNENYWNDGTRTVGADAPASKVNLYEAMKYCNWLSSSNINIGLYEDQGGGVWGAKYDRATVMAGTTNYYAVPTEDEWYKAAYYSDSSYSRYADGVGSGSTPAPTKGGGAIGWNYDNVIPAESTNRTRNVALGSTEQNGTMNMMGNVWEWMEDPEGVLRGGAYFTSSYLLGSTSRTLESAGNESPSVGLRPVLIPEPSSITMIGLVGGLALFIRKRLVM